MHRWVCACTEVDGMGSAALGGYPGLPGLPPNCGEGDLQGLPYGLRPVVPHT